MRLPACLHAWHLWLLLAVLSITGGPTRLLAPQPACPPAAASTGSCSPARLTGPSRSHSRVAAAARDPPFRCAGQAPARQGGQGGARPQASQQAQREPIRERPQPQQVCAALPPALAADGGLIPTHSVSQPVLATQGWRVAGHMPALSSRRVHASAAPRLVMASSTASSVAQGLPVQQADRARHSVQHWLPCTLCCLLLCATPCCRAMCARSSAAGRVGPGQPPRSGTGAAAPEAPT